MSYKIEQWADNENGWDMDKSVPGIMLFANAVQVWSMMQNRPHILLTHAARAFNVAVIRIQEAVEAHPYMFVDNFEGMEIIGHEGE